uniref:Uncharacterized protein n=1 Tax=Romanomermis culicivorax TaxID=13658 RepID=A0A915HZC7_ROMCU
MVDELKNFDTNPIDLDDYSANDRSDQDESTIETIREPNIENANVCASSSVKSDDSNTKEGLA